MECCNALRSRSNFASSKFLEMKDRGGLFKRTKCVIMVGQETEECFGRMLASTAGGLPFCKGKEKPIS